MNYEKMIAVNRIESEQKIKLATMAIEQLIERGEYPSVTLLEIGRASCRERVSSPV